jgi:hypothetical protein
MKRISIWLCVALATLSCVPVIFAQQQSQLAASIVSSVSGSGTTNFIPIWTSSTTLGNSILSQTAGKVGIGAIAPADRVDVEFPGTGHLLFGAPFSSISGGTAPFLRFQCTSANCGGTNFDGGELNLQGGFDVPDGGRIRLGGGNRGDAEINVVQFFQGTTETMRIQNGGNVGIGTTSPAATLHVVGNFIATGTKTALVETASYGKRLLYAMESPENWFEDVGGSRLIGGRVVVKLDPIFAETVNTENEYHVFLTPKGDCKGLYVASQTATSFEVRELQHGKGSIAFDYRVLAKRKGFEQDRLAELKNGEDARATEIKLAANRK